MLGVAFGQQSQCLHFNGCPMHIRTIRSLIRLRESSYWGPCLLPTWSLNILASELNAPEMLKIIQVLKNLMFSNSQALGHALPFYRTFYQGLLVIHALVTSH